MQTKLLHIFRNTPVGRETALQSVYFCDKIGATPTVYIPKHIRFLMYFDNDVVQVDLDGSYLTSPETALQHASEIFHLKDLKPKFLEPTNFTASELPDLPTDFDVMCCPRSISDLSSKIGLGYIGARVRRIVRSARFPVLIVSPSYKEWHSIAVFFGGSENSVKALKLGIRMARTSGLPLNVYTQQEKGYQEAYEKAMQDEYLKADVEAMVQTWRVFKDGAFEENLYEIPHDALVVVGAYGHGIIKDMVFGSKMEKIQSAILNNMLIVGPNHAASL